MLTLKNTQRAKVINLFDGRIVKHYHGPLARARFANEVRILRHLNRQGCPFVPLLLDSDDQELSITTEYCGHNVEHISEERLPRIFDRLLEFGVRHDDQAVRNVLYNAQTGNFSIIDFEFAELVEEYSSFQQSVEQRLDEIEFVVNQELEF